MREGFVNINCIPTHIFTWGNWIEDSIEKNEVVICITGNPGLAGFYTQFMSTISQKIGADVPVWVIGHAGHDEPPKTSLKRVPGLEGNEEKYGLDAQVQHKVEFIRKYVPANAKIHLIGHSIGAWIILELLKIPEIKDRIHHCYMLFPTIEHMSESPNGWWYRKILQPYWSIIYFFAVLLSYAPMSLKAFLLFIYFYLFSVPRYFLGTTLKYLRPTILSKIVFMADEEMDRVIEADYEHIGKHKEMLTFYYGATDGWTPVSYVKRLREKIPEIDAQLCVCGYAHAFVLRSSVSVGTLVANWILENRVN